VLLGVAHGAVCFFIPYYSLATSGTHNITDVYSLGKVAFVALLGAVTLEVALVARYWTWLFGILTLLSYALVYPYLVVFPLAGGRAAAWGPAGWLLTEARMLIAVLLLILTVTCCCRINRKPSATPCPLCAELWVGYYDPSNIGVSTQVLASPTFWLVILVCYVITFGVRFVERTADWSFKPQDTFILAEKVGAGLACQQHVC
jgi:magnesium-transporting ATPase (P-type)